ncbi:orotidine 5'-phosphate decarboxylase [Methanogenium sp. S4BF]|uniref:orotidine 5'-phosphate decarboxylase / HUMPS family protein n=1 Tax=Methanogenium sp. S4BF TaxID=1789226 RepID=UPI002416C68B|nr:orotidine 5'-phosphate decarboxylase / HUMPS family protein [Methanogenium sp. S4BF]WFN34584.1 orotidine 5'-phosphate decarboxylase [Methanogenium sp. S4BF]
MNSPHLQVALDIQEAGRAVPIALEAVAGGADWIEAGTPLIKSAGMDAVRRLREAFPDNEIIADMKIADTGTIEVEMAAKAGASIICVLADADDAVIQDAVRAARLYGVRLMADLINTGNPAERARELEALGIDIINAHVGIDQQMIGKSSLDTLSAIIGEVTIPVAVAGGLDAATAAQAVAAGAAIVIVGGNIVRSNDVTGSAAQIRAAIDDPSIVPPEKKSTGEEIRALFAQVSAPNVTDAMHRTGAMQRIVSICGRVRMAGPAVTVQTFGGDWAKPVEAIDVAQPGDVIVINNSGDSSVSPWGELATLSAMNRKVAGIVIDGPVRDVDDIREYGFPVFATGVVPNAGEPKGFGEIGAGITCCGQTVRPGDWIVGDESGVVVVPRERAYEVARRALEVNKTERRIREEIRRGATLAAVTELLKWEKK